MHINWERSCTLLMDLIEGNPGKKKGQYDKAKLFGLIRFVYPDVLEKGSSWKKALLKSGHEEWIDLLMRIPEEERYQIFEHCVQDMAERHPDAIQDLVQELDLAIQPPAVRREKNIEKLNRYLRRIDAAIQDGRYTLALKLTNRCLIEYYRAFMRSHQISSIGMVEDINLMSIHICRYIIGYFRKYRIPYTERRVLLITTVTNVLFTTMRNIQSSTKKYKVDKAIAIYARNNMNRIARFLSRYI